jgi:hypothetical protein
METTMARISTQSTQEPPDRRLDALLEVVRSDATAGELAVLERVLERILEARADRQERARAA